jgi:interferon-induced transmembrane protein
MATASTPSAAPDPPIEAPAAPIGPAAGQMNPAVGPPPPAPSAPVGWVIAAMLLFWPTGIPALLASLRAARAFGASDTQTAVRESANAKRWGIISVCIGAALVVLSVLLSLAWVVLVAVAVHEGTHDGVWERGSGTMHELPFGDADDSGRSGMPDRQGSGG